MSQVGWLGAAIGAVAAMVWWFRRSRAKTDVVATT
jgi:hypothetical protein